MLSLTVHKDKCIYIETPDGKTIEIMLLKTRVGQATLGFNAPSNYKILREELINKQEKSNCA